MKTLANIVLHGSECSRRTAWRTWPGFTTLHFADGSTKYLAQCGFDSAVEQAKAMGADTADFERRMAEAERRLVYPPKPEHATEYQHGYGYEVPVDMGKWEWSVTFGRWSRLVTFADGWHGYTFPKL